MIPEVSFEDAKQRFKAVNHNPLTPLNFLKRSERVFPNKKAVVYRDKEFTYKQFAERVYRVANGLKSLGVVKNDRVVIISRNNNACLETLYGVGMAGAVSAPLNYRFKSPEAVYILNQSEAKVLVFEHVYVDEIRAALPQLKTVKYFIEIDSPDKQDGDYIGIPYEEFIASSSPESMEVPVTDEDDMISITYTSGTTGPSKGCVYTHRSVYLNAMAEALEARLNSDSVYLWTLPMFHCNGWCFVWSVTMVGARHICLDAVRPEQIFEVMAQEKVTNMCGAPTVYTMITDYMSRNNLHTPLPIRGFIGGAPPSAKIITEAEKAGIDINQVYGLSEVYGPHIFGEWHGEEWANVTMAEKARLKARQGVPYPTCTFVRVVNEDMNDVPWDGETRGEIIMQGNNVMQGYFNEPDRTEKAFRGGWFHSGDAAIIYPDGYLEIVDRIKDIVNTGGEKVSSVEVETCIAQYPGVTDAAVIGKPDEKWGEIVKAFVTLSPGAQVTSADLIKFCRENLAGWKTPREIEFGDIPRTSTGKIMKNELKKREIEKAAKVTAVK